MAFYLIGTGMSEGSISREALDILKKCDKIYLENYTVNFPYSLDVLSKGYGVEISELDRGRVEDESIIEEAEGKDVALLVYGDCLSATTHLQLVLACRKSGVAYKIFHNASILTCVAECGLSLYKFGKTTSMPDWREHTNRPTSFLNYVRENFSIGAHTLILTDIGLSIGDAMGQLEEACLKEGFDLPGRIVVLSNVGTERQKVFYDSVGELKGKDVGMPFCLVVPGEMGHVEEEALEGLARDEYDKS